jgi:4-hydroxy-tetrahydrodipicolinate reductase
MLHIALLGATGRMGRAVLEALTDAPDLRIVGALASPASPAIGNDIGVLCGRADCGVRVTGDPAAALQQAHVALDFSVAEASARNTEACSTRGCALVTGVTGLDDAAVACLHDAARRIAIVQAANMSLGVALCLELAARAAAVLHDYDVEILDVHHRHKRDAPSGTARELGAAVAEARAQEGRVTEHTGSRSGPRPGGGIGYASLRLGEVTGEHTVLFASAGERVEITHRATGRGAFAQGALSAARWVAGRRPGLYGMRDVLGLAPART